MIVVATVVGLAVIAGLAVAAVLALLDSRRVEDEIAREFTSSDGTFTMTLPAGWADETEAYRADVLERNGTESTIEGLVTVDGLPHAFSDNFVSMSGHPIGAVPQTPEQIGQGLVDNWRDNFDDYTELAPATFMTDAGDSVWHGGLRGTTDGEEWMIVIATVVGDGSLALFDLELTPHYYDASDAFLESLKSVVFAPTTAAEEVAPNFEPEADGRTYSSELGASLIIPDSWTQLHVDADADAFNPEIDFDFLGFWQVGDGVPFDAPGAWLLVSKRADTELGVLDTLVTQFGEVGAVTSDGKGATYTVRAYGPWTGPSTTDSAWVELVVDLDASGVAEPDGVDKVQRCYVLASAGRQVSAVIEADPDDIATAIDSVESALLTLEFAR